MNERQLELIQAGVDGELDDSGQAELDQLLEVSEEARHYHSELNRLAVFLDKIPDHELPEGVHARIVENLPQAGRRSILASLGLNQVPVMLRYGLAGAAGMLVGAVLLAEQQPMPPGEDLASMAGTMAGTMAKGVHRGQELDAFSFEQDGISGRASLSQREESLVLDIGLDAPGEVEFKIDLSGNDLVINGIAQMNDGLQGLNWTGDVLSGQASGQQRFVVLMRDVGEIAVEPGTRIGVVISRDGAVIHRDWLIPES